MKKPPKKSNSVRDDKRSQALSSSPTHKEKSPSISRTIPEFKAPGWVKLATVKTHWDVLFVSFLSGVLLMAIIVMGFRVFNHRDELLKKQSQREELMQKREYWRGIVEKYPDYKDAYYQLAVFSYELGEVAGAREAVEHALKIDPNDENGNRLLAKIRG